MPASEKTLMALASPAQTAISISVSLFALMASPDSLECHICRLPLAPRSISVRHNECPFCGRTFRRVDGAKRHSKTCSFRGNRLLPPDAKRGRKVHACDICSRVKVSCDSNSPCTRCASRGLSCTYGRLCSNPTHRGKLMPVNAPPAVDKGHSALPFLLACTDPSVGPVDEVILSREAEQDPGRPAAWNPPDYSYTIPDTIDPRLLFLSFIGPSFSVDLESDVTKDELGRLDMGSSHEELQIRVGLLEVDLQQVAKTESQLEGAFHTSLTAEFFTVSHFRECIRLFFEREQLLATIIHRPTFYPGRVHLSLLLAIAVCGSTYFHYRKGSGDSASFLSALREIAEKYIFHRVEQLLCLTVQPVDYQWSLELCQAAYMIETLQSCVKNVKIRQRLITKYHPMLVDLLRHLDIIKSRQEPLGAEQDWVKFVYKESCIRLLHWAFINDAWFTLLSNHPPAMTLFDMNCRLPCAGNFWNVSGPAEFDSVKSQQDSTTGLPCLKLLVSGLLGNDWTEDTVNLFKKLEVKHYLVLIFAFQHVIFHYHTSIVVDNSSTILLRALDRWDQLWNDAMSQIDMEGRKTLGLVKFSPEIAFLSRRIVEFSIAKEDTDLKYLQRSVTYDTMILYQLVRQCAG